MSSEKIDLDYVAPSIHPDKTGVYTSNHILNPLMVAQKSFNNIYALFHKARASSFSMLNGETHFGIFPYTLDVKDRMHELGCRNAFYETFLMPEGNIQIECFGIWDLKAPITPKLFESEDSKIRRIEILVSTLPNHESIHASVKRDIERLVDYVNKGDI